MDTTKKTDESVNKTDEAAIKTDEAVMKRTLDVFLPGLKPSQVVANYDDWAESYEQMLGDGRLNASTIAVEEVAEMVPEERRTEVRVLDVAAGTGLVGLHLHKKGFTKIDALEPSEGMMNVLKEKKVYSKTYLDLITSTPTTVPTGTYDVVVISGGMGDSHIPVQGVDEFIRVAKPGGLVIIVMRLEFLWITEQYKDKLEPYMDQLEKQGVWRKEARKVVPNYYFKKDGVVFIYRVL
ncbi:methyltransferase-like protein 27 [Procambarus clarkii]|uniref:methyltransferase-like protein 27 n=1 Tax=Procambarus clarkii TaxID=6728 RepID=UPI001E675A9F|nr:methyltransferase-like protein 27 [Procambarus clarkii]XP_045614327.1 methyltransferase-like protein 27 [Procambarus clarkii]